VQRFSARVRAPAGSFLSSAALASSSCSHQRPNGRMARAAAEAADAAGDPFATAPGHARRSQRRAAPARPRPAPAVPRYLSEADLRSQRMGSRHDPTLVVPTAPAPHPYLDIVWRRRSETSAKRSSMYANRSLRDGSHVAEQPATRWETAFAIVASGNSDSRGAQRR